jgi:hypothetical protein
MSELTEKQHSDLEAAVKALLSEADRAVRLPVDFIDSVEKLGAHRAICEFLKPDGGFPKELIKLHQAGKIPLSIEAFVLQPEWKEFFDEPLLIEASSRLQEIGSVLP